MRISRRRAVLLASLLSLALFRVSPRAAPPPGAGAVELLRDTWGVPHIFASTDAGAMFGLGYATAQDRGFQMHYLLRLMQGRLAETIGDELKNQRGERPSQHDRKMRHFGFYRSAQTVAENLDAETKELLGAYAEGVNAFFRERREDRHYLFGKFGFEPEPWTPADSIVSWWHLAQFFGTDGTRDLVAYRGELQRDPPGPESRLQAQPDRLAPDDAAAVVRREDVTGEWLAQIEQFQRTHRLSRPSAPGAAGPRFSHAWVVGGRKSGTGSAVLVSDPRTVVANPPLLYHFHVQGQGFNARGVGVPGSPLILIGFTADVAWGMTALGGDQADLFRLQTSPAHPDQYYFEGEWRRMEVEDQLIRVKGGPDQTVTVRRTHWGPVITDYVFAGPADGEFALKRIPLAEPDRDTIQGALAMLRARSVEEFFRALEGWRFPTANVVFGDRAGGIGYSVAGAFPVHSEQAVQAGRFPHQGAESRFDWQGMIPQELLPHVLNPDRDFLFSANHRPIGAFYPLPLGAGTGWLGETLRSLRLRELFADRDTLSPDEVLAMHLDEVNPARRDLVRLGLHLRDQLERDLSAESQKALEQLEPWFRGGARSNRTLSGSELAEEIPVAFRVFSTPLAQDYGGGESGLARFLQDLRERIERNPRAELSETEQRFVESVLSQAWQSAVRRYGPQPALWRKRAREAVVEQRVEYYRGLDGFPSLDPAQDLAWPELTSLDGGTLRSQTSQAFTQFVPLHNPDRALALLPMGNSEAPGHPRRTATRALWEKGELHPAPLSRAALEPHVVERRALRFEFSGRSPSGDGNVPVSE